ncbi:MAG: FimV/HubP family polar landmark protein [Comamonadaceae bacterium]|nr:FimV/HubP family polar landmark protein [Comamonadaceae bacterium]
MHRWKHSALAAAVALTAGLHGPAAALTLGQIRVQSHLGEPLRATIPVSNLTADEAQTLQANPASPDVFNAHGANYSSIMTRLQVTLQRKADGSAQLLLSTPMPVNEPFVDLVLSATWNGGNAVRSYAVLLDPPISPKRSAAAGSAGAQSAATPKDDAPVAAAVPARPAPAMAPVVAPRTSARVQGDDVYQRARNWMQSQGQTVSGAVASAPKPSRAAASRAGGKARASSMPAVGAEGAVRTRRGDTASSIARRHLPSGVSLDQMLVALQRANPHAFIRDNVNLLRSGVTLEIPDLAEVQAVSAHEARRQIVAQTRDFNQYRNRAAARVATVPAAKHKSDTAVGRVTAPVTAPAAPQGDTLKLSSQQASQAQKRVEQQLVMQRQKEEDEARRLEAETNAQKARELLEQAKELNGNGNNVGGAARESAGIVPIEAPPPVPLPQPPAEMPAAASDVAPVDEVKLAEQAAKAAEMPEPAPVPVESVPVEPPAPVEPVQPPKPPEPPKPAERPRPAPAPVVEESFLDSLLANPWLPYMGGGLLALLGFGLYYRYRKGRSGEDVVYENSNIPDSFFASSRGGNSQGGASAASTQSASSGMSTAVSSMSYSPSQIDATGEGDPVLEADVLLAYGRDQQAEEVLKEAEISNPTRAAIKVRLAEIYASRQDRLLFEAKASELAKLTQQTGADWAKVAELGRNLDPTNPLYQNPQQGAGGVEDPNAGADSSLLSGFGPLSGLDFDFQQSSLAPVNDDLDSKQGEERRAGPASAPSPAGLADLGLDLNLGDIDAPSSVAAGLPHDDAAHATIPTLPSAQEETSASVPAAMSQPESLSEEGPKSSLEFDLSDMDFSLPPIEPETQPKPEADDPVEGERSFLGELDLGSDTMADEDPLATKLALAREFQGLGDSEGARALLQEVIAQADGPLKAKAQAMLDGLNS